MFPLDLGGGLVLHPARTADADELFSLVDADRQRLREWLPWVDGTATADTVRTFLAGVEASSERRNGIHTVVRLDGRAAGVADLTFDGLDNGHVGYWLAARALGRGVMTRVVAELIDLGFGVAELHRIELQAPTGNHRSRAVAERLGMTLEGVRRQAERLPSGFVDLAVYSVLASEWAGASTVLAAYGTGERRNR